MNKFKSKISNIIVSPSISLLDALKKMDSEKTKMLFVFSNEHFVSILTIGDIQRSIIRGISLTDKIDAIIERDKIYIHPNTSKEEVKAIMVRERCQYMPIVDEIGEMIDVLLWDEMFNTPQEKERGKIDLPVVIMAGGKGTRLKPLTNVIPKPLIPIGDKTILEVIMDQFEEIGCHNFFMSVNYKADMIKYYLSQLSHQYDIEFFMEDKPLGTIGSVSLLKGKIKMPFFVSNCDSINDQDYRDVYDYHLSNHNDMTVVTLVKSFKIPYGVIETAENGLMVDLKEKPEHTYMVNSGVYILNPELIDEIPKGELFHITHLMERVKSRGGRVGCFPVSEDSWHDMGEWPEYLKMIGVQ